MTNSMAPPVWVRACLRRPSWLALSLDEAKALLIFLMLTSLSFSLLTVFSDKVGYGGQQYEKVNALSLTYFTEQDFNARRNLYDKACKHGNGYNFTLATILLNENYRLAYCFTPKVGSTFWKRFFRFLAGSGVKSLFDIDRYSAHFAVERFQKFDSNSSAEINEDLKPTTLKFMFTRDPYARLWSAYMDKLLLPDFWISHGMRILRYRNRNSTRKQSCPKDISFGEFVRYAMLVSDVHWKPVAAVCDPCLFQPHLVGHLESFSRDRDFILAKSNLSHLLKDHGHGKHFEDEVRIVTDYNFGLYERKFIREKCLKYAELAVRLWRVFQFNGYIRTSAAFPLTKIEQGVGENVSVAKKHVRNVFVEQLRKDPLSEHEHLQQRKAALRAAYRDLSPYTRMRVKRHYAIDFLLFGYNSTLPV